MSPAIAKGKPDLVVPRLSAAVSSASQGSRINVSGKIKNKGKKKAGRSTAAAYLSLVKTGDRFQDLTLGTTTVKKLLPSRSGTISIKGEVPAAAPPGPYHLILCADVFEKVSEAKEKNNCRTGGVVQVTAAPSSSRLIEDALDAGEIDEEDALLYEVFADFGDPRLPPAYRGTSDAMGHGHLTEVLARWDELSEETQATLEPFFVPPQYEGSWFDLRSKPKEASRLAADGGEACTGRLLGSWKHIDTANGKVRIWYLKKHETTDLPKARAIKEAIDGYIWVELKKLMGREPKLDFGSENHCRGGTDHLDLSLVDVPAKTDTSPYKTASMISCSAVETYIHIDRNRKDIRGQDDLIPTVAHELMHAVQYAFPLADSSCGGMLAYHWLQEATAQWVQDYLPIPPGPMSPANSEQAAAPLYLGQSWYSLNQDNIKPGDSQTDILHSYGAYLFPFFLAGKAKNGAVVRKMWENGFTAPSSLDAVDKAIAGGFKEQWKKFVLYNWNQAAPLNHYAQWDGLTEGAKPWRKYEVQIPTPPGEVRIEIDPSLPHLSSSYYEFDFVDEATKRVVFFNNFPGNVPHADLQAIVKFPGGPWHAEDWTNHPSKTFCEKPEKIFLIVSNHSKTEWIEDHAPVMYAYDSDLQCPNRGRNACTGRSAQTVSASCEISLPETITGNVSGSWSHDDGEFSASASWSGTVTFKRDLYGNGSEPMYYRVLHGSLPYQYAGPCTSGSGTAKLEEDDGALDLRYDETEGRFTYDSYGFGGGDGITYTYTCPRDPDTDPDVYAPYTGAADFGVGWLVTGYVEGWDPIPRDVTFDPETGAFMLSGSWKAPPEMVGEMDQSWSWNLHGE